VLHISASPFNEVVEVPTSEDLREFFQNWCLFSPTSPASEDCPA
jgi:hypothetical protein